MRSQSYNKYRWPWRAVVDDVGNGITDSLGSVRVQVGSCLVEVPSSLLGFQSRAQHAHHQGDNGEALSEDPTPHQQLGLSGFPLMEGAEAVKQRACCSQTTYRDEWVLLGFSHELLLERLLLQPLHGIEAGDDGRLGEVKRRGPGRR